MRKKVFAVIASVGIAMVIAGCQTTPNEPAGGIVGGIIGGVVGNQFGSGGGKIVATAVGAGIGALVGSNIARELDQESRARASGAMTQALNSSHAGGREVTWSNPGNPSGLASGTVRITRNGRDNIGRACREYHQTVNIAGKTQQAYGIACQDGNGDWEIVN